MAYIEKVGKNSYRIIYYLNGKKKTRSVPPGTPVKLVQSFKKEIEVKVALHKASIKKFVEDEDQEKSLTLTEMASKILELRKDEVSEDTQYRNEYAMKIFIKVVGANLPVAELKDSHIAQFKKSRLELKKQEHESKQKPVDENQIKRGINKDLVNIKAVFNAAAQKGIILESQVPNFEFYRVEQIRLPQTLDEQEIQAIASQLEGDALLAFWIIRYTGARRGEVAHRSAEDDHGLKWIHIDFENSRIRLSGKGKEKYVPMHPRLSEKLQARRNELGEAYNPEDLVIRFRRDTLSAYFREAIEKAGIKKRGAVHILRHTAATALLDAGANLREVQEFLGHSRVTTTEIYTHISKEKLKSKVDQAFE